MHEGARPRYERLIDRGAKQMWPMWMPDGKTLYFVSDRSGAQNVWALTLGMTPRQITRFTGGRVLWPMMSYDGRTMVFERDFEIWTLDTADHRAAPVKISKRGVAAVPLVDRVTLNNGFQDLAL